MQAEKFVAPNIQDALKLVKEKFGKNAVILSTKKVRKSTSTFGMFSKEMIEVTAMAEMQPVKRSTNRQPASANKTWPASLPATDETEPLHGAPQYDRYGRKTANNQAASNYDYDPTNDFQKVRPGWSNQTEDLSEFREMLTEFKDNANQRKNDAGQMQYMRQEIQELKALVRSFVSSKEQSIAPDWNEHLTALYQQMTFNGLEEKFAKRVIEELKTKVSAANLDDYEYLKLYATRIFFQSLNCTSMLEETLPKQAIYSFIGVTGVGKTTTIAKIASFLKTQSKDAKIALVTLDTFRIGALEQLKEYAKIIRIPFRVAGSFEELQTVLKGLKDFNYILIDTPGTSQRDEERLEEVRTILQAKSQIKNILVLNSTTRDFELCEITKRFAKYQFAGFIFTKLDEASTYGAIVNHLIRFKMPAYFLSTGQIVPDDLETATPERLVDLLLHLGE